jgi:Protein of unknown function (DUF1064)
MASKYNAKTVELDGYIFDSKLEARYYELLKEKQKNDEILFFRVQPIYQLQETFKKYNKTFRRIDYIADFEVHHLDGSIEVIDVKGFRTQTFNIKRKLFEYKYPHKLTLITYSKKWGGWIELEELERKRRQSRKCKR